MVEKEKVISMLEDMDKTLDKKDWTNELKEKIQQYKKKLGISFIIDD